MRIVFRHGRILQIDSRVFLPITIVCPSVVSLKCLKSSGIYQGIFPFFPMARFSDMAAIAMKWIDMVKSFRILKHLLRKQLPLETRTSFISQSLRLSTSSCNSGLYRLDMSDDLGLDREWRKRDFNFFDRRSANVWLSSTK